MGKSVPILVLLIFVIRSTKGQGYMEFSCQPDFIEDGNDEAIGRGLATNIEMRCIDFVDEFTDEICYNGCVLEKHGILKENERILNSPESMAKQLGRLFRPSASSEKLAATIFHKCQAVAEKTKKLPWDDRSTLYECVQNAIGLLRK